VKHRLILAIELPRTREQSVANIKAKINKLSNKVVWEESSRLKVILNFLGRVNDEDISKCMGQIQKIASNQGKFSLSFQFLDALYKKHEQSEIYLNVYDTDGQLKLLQKDISAALESIQIKQPLRFQPQLILGHVEKSDPSTTKKILDDIRTVEDIIPFDMEVTKLTVYEISQSKRGDHIQKFADFNLDLNLV